MSDKVYFPKKERIDSGNMFVEDAIRNAGLYQLRKQKELARDLYDLRNSLLLPPHVIRAVVWYLERYEGSANWSKVSWETQLSHMSNCPIGDQLLERAGIQILPLAKRVQLDVQFQQLRDNAPERDLYLVYVGECRIKWQAYRARFESEVFSDAVVVDEPKL
jgi:hypothetical protein